MSVGFNPNHTEDLPLDDLTPKQFLVIAVDIMQELDWDIRHISDAGSIAISTKKIFKRKSKITVRIGADQVTIKSESLGNEMMDWGKNKKLTGEFTLLLEERKQSFSPEELEEKYEQLRGSLVPPEEDILSQPPPGKTSFFSFFVPSRGYYVTPIIIDLNIAIFLLMVLSGVSVFAPSTSSLIRWGANFRPSTLDGGWWRLITNCFLHIGIFHLLLNMYALLYIGVLLEPRLGKLRFAAAYLFTGIIASLTSLYWHDLTVSAGASGAIFGLYGVFLALLTTNFIEKTTRKAFLASIGVFVAYNLLYGMKSGIDNAAHLGGLVSGMIIGYLYVPGLKQPLKKGLTFIAIALTAIAVFTTSFFVYHNVSNDIGIYQKKMNDFAAMEKRALSVYSHMSSDTPRAQILRLIQDTGIYYWNKDLELLNEAEKLQLPKQLKKRLSTLRDYCDIRIENYNYLYRTLEADMGQDNDSVKYYNTRLQATIDEIKNE